MDSDSKQAILTGDLHTFFGDLIREAADLRKTLASPLAIDYVAKLFVKFADTESFFHPSHVKLPVLADMLAEAIEADVYRRISILRRLGDTSLMFSGYFPEALAKRNVDTSYYVQMGETAYLQLDRLADRNSVFGELSERFKVFAELIGQVRVGIDTQDLDSEELLERYSESESPEILLKLKRQGIVPFVSAKHRKDS